MLVNLVTRYGVMPKKCFPDSYSSESSLRMNSILKSKVFGLNRIFFAINENKFYRYSCASMLSFCKTWLLKVYLKTKSVKALKNSC